MKRTNSFKILNAMVALVVVAAVFSLGFYFYDKYVQEKKILKEMIARLEADSRIAQVVVTQVAHDPVNQKTLTTIKFLEFDSLGKPLEPKYFTFSGNIIQFQSLVVRFKDAFITSGDRLRGKSVYLFWKAFMLKGADTEEYIITPTDEVPAGYRTQRQPRGFEERIWREFWDYALDARKASAQGIKNAQIEAPGTKIVPGIVYTLKIEHDGGIRIDPSEIPAILKGEKVL